MSAKRDVPSARLKRKGPDEEGPSSSQLVSKKRRADHKCGCHILDLSDDVLLLILCHLSSSDLLNLSQVCRRLLMVASDRSLWIKVSTVSSPLALSHFRSLFKFMHDKTTEVAIGGFLKDPDRMRQESVSAALLAKLVASCSELSTLVFHDCLIDASKVKVEHLPRSLLHLGFVNCDVINMPATESYFFNLCQALPNLIHIDLTNARWFRNHSIQALSKCTNLRRINLNGCRRMGECFVYTALATRFGFRGITYIDLRNTSIGDMEVACLGRLPEVTHLLLGYTVCEAYVPPDYMESDGIITDRGVHCLCPQVGNNDYVSKIKHLSLTKTHITEKSASMLLTTLALEFLDISGTAIAEDSIERLQSLNSLCVLVHRSDLGLSS